MFGNMEKNDYLYIKYKKHHFKSKSNEDVQRTEAFLRDQQCPLRG